MSLEFSGEIWHWAGPAPFFFVTVPAEDGEVLRDVSKWVTYGWGMIPVKARIGKTEWNTSLFPREGSYVVPIKVSTEFSVKQHKVIGDFETVDLLRKSQLKIKLGEKS